MVARTELYLHVSWLLLPFLYFVSAGNRGLVHGRLWRRDGVLAVSVVQEGLVRGTHRSRPKPKIKIENENDNPNKISDQENEQHSNKISDQIENSKL